MANPVNLARRAFMRAAGIGAIAAPIGVKQVTRSLTGGVSAGSLGVAVPKCGSPDQVDPAWVLREPHRKAFNAATRAQGRKELLYVDGFPADISACRSWSPAFKRIANQQREKEIIGGWRQLYRAAFGEDNEEWDGL